MLLITLAAAAVAAAVDIPVVPLPQSWSWPGQSLVALSPGLQLAGAGAQVPTIAAAFTRFLARSLPQYRSDGAGGEGCSGSGYSLVSRVDVTVSNASEAHPQYGDDESYTLTVAAPAITLSCARVTGCLHGLSSLSQLVNYTFLVPGSGGGCYAAAAATLTDAPRFSHRGLMLDTARHFYPLPALLQLLDAMAAVKLSVLHWHLVDDQAFPLVVPGTQLSQAGAFDAASMYSAGDVAEVVEYARARGIRVVPEIDSPGHSAAWCAGYPDACVTCNTGQAPAALNPASNATLPLVATVLQRIRALFPDNWIHLGGDEIDLKCWTQDAALAAWLAAKYPGLSPMAAAAAEAYGSYIPSVQAAAVAAGYSRADGLVAWEDAFDFASPGCGGIAPTLPNSTIIEVFRQGWGPDAPGNGTCGRNTTYTTADATSAGYCVLWMPPDSWYLTCYSDTCGTDGGGAGWETWQAIYAGEPFAGLPDPAQQALVLGGEATLWSERLDAAILLPVAFPRAAAVAERLWSPANTTDTASAHARLTALRARLLAWGLPASSVDGGNEASAFGLPSRPAGPGQP